MISRLTASAALFAVLATASLTFAAESQHRFAATRQDSARAAALEVVQLPTVTVIGRRTL